MTKDKISRIYAIVHLLEAHLAVEDYRISRFEQKNPLCTSKQEQYAETLASMRKLANQIQLQFARKDFEEASRSEKIFRGLQAMLGPEVLIKIRKAGLAPLPVHHESIDLAVAVNS